MVCHDLCCVDQWKAVWGGPLALARQRQQKKQIPPLRCGMTNKKTCNDKNRSRSPSGMTNQLNGNSNSNSNSNGNGNGNSNGNGNGNGLRSSCIHPIQC
jgi:hypothetical protein